MVITDKENNLEWVNEAFETTTGYTLAEVIGKNPRTFLQYDDTNLAISMAIREALNKEIPLRVK